jgi:integrase
MRNLREKLLADCSSRNTAKHALNLANSILSYAVMLDEIETNPAQGVGIRLDWHQGAETKVERIPSDAEMRELDEMAKRLYESRNPRVALGHQRYYPMYLLLRTTGIRISECLGLQWKDFADDYDSITIRRKVDRKRRGIDTSERVGSTKSKNSRRTIPLPTSIRPTLRKWRLSCPVSSEGWVFPTQAGEPMDYNNVKNKFWKPLLTRVNKERMEGGKPPLVDHGLHGLRHYFVSMLVREGRVKEASAYAGHSSVAFTLDTYGHLIPDDAKTVDEFTTIVSRNLTM